MAYSARIFILWVYKNSILVHLYCKMYKNRILVYALTKKMYKNSILVHFTVQVYKNSILVRMFKIYKNSFLDQAGGQE